VDDLRSVFTLRATPWHAVLLEPSWCSAFPGGNISSCPPWCPKPAKSIHSTCFIV